MTFDKLIERFKVPSIEIGTEVVYDGFESIIFSNEKDLFQIKNIDTGWGEEEIEFDFSYNSILDLIINEFINDWLSFNFKEGLSIGGVTILSIKFNSLREITLNCGESSIPLFREYMLNYFRFHHPELTSDALTPVKLINKGIKTLKDVNLILFKRYKVTLSEYKKYADDEIIIRAKNMIDIALSEDMYEDKQSRWLGFIQGVMTVYDLLDVEDERDFSRPLFHKAYEEMGLEKPKSISV